MEGLIESHFFEDYEIKDLTFARNHIMESLNEKYINNLLGLDDDDNETEIYTEEEFEKLLKEIVAGTILYELKQNGFLESYEDENTEETFFLTEKGKSHLKNNKTF
jgi:hypothetical protein